MCINNNQNYQIHIYIQNIRERERERERENFFYIKSYFIKFFRALHGFFTCYNCLKKINPIELHTHSQC